MGDGFERAPARCPRRPRAAARRRRRAGRRRAATGSRHRRHRRRRRPSAPAAARACGRARWPPPHWRAQDVDQRAAGVGRLAAASSADSRTTVRIVPSIGVSTAGRPPRSPPPAPRRRRPVASVSGLQRRREAAQDLARITPLLPRAPISEPWLIASQVAADLGRRLVHLGDHGVEGAGHVRAGVAVGHRIHVEPVDPRGMGVTTSRNVVTVSRRASTPSSSSVGTTFT